ncbi:hypothetical protein Tco_0237846 [Tanacetum coccineum]
MRTGKEVGSSTKSSTTKESTKANDADEPHVHPKPKIQKKDWFKDSPKPEVLDPEWNTIKAIDDTPEQPCYAELEYNMEECYRALTDQLDWTNLEGNKERTYSSSITKAPATRYTMEGIEDMIPTLWSPIVLHYDKDAALGIKYWRPQR